MTSTNHAIDPVVEHLDLVDLDVRMFTVHHQAAAQKRLLVVCSPLGSEQVANYRREVGVARALAERGTSVLRHHPRGHGDSRGEPDQISIGQLAADAVALARQVGGVDELPVAVLGTRVAAPVALRVASQLDAQSVALWCPVTPKRFLREALRARAVGGLKQGRSPEEPDEALAARGCLDVVGYEFSSRLYEEFSADDTVCVDGLTVRRALVVDVGRRGGQGRRYAEALAEAGCEVEHKTLEGAVGWWLATGRLEDGEQSPESQGLIDLTTAWIDEDPS